MCHTVPGKCQGPQNRIFVSFCDRIHRKHPTHYNTLLAPHCSVGPKLSARSRPPSGLSFDSSFFHAWKQPKENKQIFWGPHRYLDLAARPTIVRLRSLDNTSAPPRRLGVHRNCPLLRSCALASHQQSGRKRGQQIQGHGPTVHPPPAGCNSPRCPYHGRCSESAHQSHPGRLAGPYDTKEKIE